MSLPILRSNDMKAASLNLFRKHTPAIALSFLVAFCLTAAAPAIFGQQQPQLSLADILIGLRSKKVTLPERNKLLTEAVLARGITFSLSAEIEKELDSTGADKTLVDSIRKKSQIVKTSATITPVVETKPSPTMAAAPSPAPPDFNFYLKRGVSSSEKGDFDGALADFGKAIEMKPDSFEAFFDRGMAHISKKALELAVSDLSRAIEINPRSAAAYSGRGSAFESKGDVQRAKTDYQKAVDLDANIEPAKSSLARIVAEELKVQREAEPINAQRYIVDNFSAGPKR